MPRGSIPPSQKNRTIGFRGTTGAMDLVIRPEELTRSEPSRLAVQQTLGGAWIDGFDRGIISIKINGTTGWHGGAPDTAGLSGEAAFHQLRDQSFTGWHAERAAIVSGGGDPNDVTLDFIDTLNGFTDRVAPKSFTLRRSKSRPLLFMYSIEMLVLSDVAEPVGLESYGATNFGYLFGANAVAGAANAVGNAINGFIGAAQGVVSGLVGQVFGTVQGAVGGAIAQGAGAAQQAANQALGPVAGGLVGGVIGNAAGAAQNAASGALGNLFGELF